MGIQRLIPTSGTDWSEYFQPILTTVETPLITRGSTDYQDVLVLTAAEKTLIRGLVLQGYLVTNDAVSVNYSGTLTLKVFKNDTELFSFDVSNTNTSGTTTSNVLATLELSFLGITATYTNQATLTPSPPSNNPATAVDYGIPLFLGQGDILKVRYFYAPTGSGLTSRRAKVSVGLRGFS